MAQIEAHEGAVIVDVDFRTVGADGRVWGMIRTGSVNVGGSAEARDADGNRCHGRVVGASEGRVELDLVLDSFRSAGE